MKNTMLKRCLTTLVTATLAAGTVLAVPTAVLATTYETSDQLNTDTGSGDIQNSDTVTEVTTTADINENHGTVDINNGTVEQNKGLVNTNNNIVKNYYGGIVVDNHGTVDAYENGSSVTNNYSDGTVNGNGFTITVDNNYEGTVGDGVTVTNQYWSVTLTGVENGETSFGGFTVVDNKNYLLNSTGSGTILITPSANYEIVNNGGGTGQYAVVSVDQGSGFNVAISNITGTTALSLDQLGLIIRAISQATGTPEDHIHIQDGTGTDSTPTTAPETNNNADQGSVSLSDVISMLSKVKFRGGPSDLNFGTKTSFSGDVMDYLCKNATTTVNCHFTYTGMEWTLTIPKIDTHSEEYKACMASLALEPGGTAGFIRLSQIFAPLGVRLTKSVIDNSTDDDLGAPTHVEAIIPKVGNEDLIEDSRDTLRSALGITNLETTTPETTRPESTEITQHINEPQSSISKNFLELIESYLKPQKQQITINLH